MSPIEIPELEEDRRFNLLTSIWLVPLIALIVSGGLIYRYFSQLGSEIRIDFASSYGLVSGESVIKFRDVAVGKITKIELQEGGDGVTVVARMNKEAEPYLNPSSHFWIVKPQIDYSGIKGLDSLIHGAYITMYAPKKGELKTDFKGLEKAYRAQDQGLTVHLRSKKIGNVHIGAPVYYRDIRAGNIEDIELSKDHASVDVTVFIQKKYTKMINTTTKFWHQNLVAINMKNGRLGIDLAPLTSVLLGSINFESKFDKQYPMPPEEHRFRLYGSRIDAIREAIGDTSIKPEYFRFVFEGKVSGLHEGIPIRYQGFGIGEIERVKTTYSAASHSMRAEAFGFIDSSIFQNNEHNGSYNLAQAVHNGLRAELRSSNPLFGDLVVGLGYPDEDTNTTDRLIIANGVVDFPTKMRVSDETLAKLQEMIDSIADITNDTKSPLKELLAKLNNSADDFNKTLDSIGSFAGKDGGLDKAIEELRNTLKATKTLMRGYSRDSIFGKKLEAMLKEVGKTSEETKRLIEKLNKKPNSLIFGD